MSTAKHKFKNFVFNPTNQKFDFSDQLQNLAKHTLGIATPANIEQLKYLKMPLHSEKLINQAHLETSKYKQIVTHLERELELNGLEALDELQVKTVGQHVTC